MKRYSGGLVGVAMVVPVAIVSALVSCALLACFTRNLFGPTDAPITYPGVSEGTPIPTAVPGPNDSPTWYARRGDGGRE